MSRTKVDVEAGSADDGGFDADLAAPGAETVEAAVERAIRDTLRDRDAPDEATLEEAFTAACRAALAAGLGTPEAVSDHGGLVLDAVQALFPDAARQPLRRIWTKTKNAWIVERQAEAAQAEAPVDHLASLGIRDPEPWDQPVAGDALAREIEAVLRRYVVMPEHGHALATLWVLHTWLLAEDAGLDFTPRLGFTAGGAEAGKTTAAEAVLSMCRRPLSAAGISQAAFFRVMDAVAPTLFLDERDKTLALSEIEALLNKGHQVGGRVIRCEKVGDEIVPRGYGVHSPVILAGIGRLGDETVTSRSIVIAMRRKLGHERTERYRPSRIAAEVADLVRKAARWATDAATAVRDLPEPACPEGLGSRAWDNLEGLTRIAAAVGAGWPARLREGVAALHGKGSSDSGGTTAADLLFDIVAIARTRAAARPGVAWSTIAIPTEELLADLLAFGDGQWNEVGTSPPRRLTPAALARMLAPFGIRSVKTDFGSTTRAAVRTGARERRHAYRMRHFVDPYARNGGDAELARRQEGSTVDAREAAIIRQELEVGRRRAGPAGATTPRGVAGAAGDRAADPNRPAHTEMAGSVSPDEAAPVVPVITLDLAAARGTRGDRAGGQPATG